MTLEHKSTYLNEIKAKLDKYAFAKKQLGDVAYNAIALNEEATETLEKSLVTNYLVQNLTIKTGRILGNTKKWMRDDDNFPYEITQERRRKIGIELFDVLFYWTYCVDSLSYTPEDILAMGIEKIAARKYRGTQHGEGDNR